MKTKTKIILARSIMLSSAVVAGLIVYFVPISITQLPPSPTTLTPTRQINETHSTGGTSVAQPESATSNATSSDSMPRPTTQQNSPKTIASASTATDNSPKQTEIRRMVSKERTYHAFLLPNDPYAQNAALLNDTQMTTAWNLSTGNPVIVADIDSGFALAHEDLQAAWQTNASEQGMTSNTDVCWTGTAEAKATNNCDDDENGYVDDWRGWNFVEVDNSPQAGRQDIKGPGVSHGTETAGLIGATTNNGIGIASFNWGTRIMPLQALADDGSGYTSDVIAAIYYAVDNGASVINMSLGSYQDDPYLDTAIQFAYDHNVVIVAAAGNCGTGQEFGCDPAIPGAIASPARNNHVIAVGAVDGNNQRASFSSYGTALDVVAPGSGSITSTMWLSSNQTSAYSATLYGTSFATPIVTSLVSLLRSERPASSVDDITAIVDGTAQKISGLAGRDYNTNYGHGLINGASAVTGCPGARAKYRCTGTKSNRQQHVRTLLCHIIPIK